MEKTAARQAYFRFLKQAEKNKARYNTNPVSSGKLLGTGISGGLFGWPGASIAGAINAPEGEGWGSAGAAGLGSLAGTIPGAVLGGVGASKLDPRLMILGQLLAHAGSGAGGAYGYYLKNRPDEEEE